MKWYQTLLTNINNYYWWDINYEFHNLAKNSSLLAYIVYIHK